MIHDVLSVLIHTDWLPKDGVARLILGGVLGSVATAVFSTLRERGTRALARRALVADRFLTSLIDALEGRLQATRHDVATDARLLIDSQMLRAEIKTAWRSTKTLVMLIDAMEQKVRFEQPAPSIEVVASQAAELISAWVQHPLRTRFSRFPPK